MGSRNWFKLYCNKWLEGTIRQEEPDVRSVFVDLLALAGNGKYGDIGEIKLVNGIGYTDTQICSILNIKRVLWVRARERFLASERIEITPKGAIIICNWLNYQSEYGRQKPYRQLKGQAISKEDEIPPSS